MPRIGILISQDKEYFWHWGLVTKGQEPFSSPERYNTMDAALAAAKLVLNRRGLINA